MHTTRRIRRALAATAALVGVLFLFGAPAGAAGESEGECIVHAVEEAEAAGLEGDELYELVEEELTACRQAPSPILPEVNEIIWGTFGFLVVFGFLYWKGYPAMKKTMDDRTERIRSDLESAESQRVEAEKVLAGYNAQLADARNESARIIEEARQTADSVRAERIAAIDGEIAEMRQRAAAEAEASKVQAMSDLRGEVTALAIGAAERVVERNLDDATNRALVDAYIDQVGANS